ncbi:putative rhodanese-related sulfurtransferase [Rhodococcus pyridinivorans AK37]|uniref:tRNA uridine(34) hydroxylase n=1 Tax=Rhodococcus pyridinivorans AK37 TaxID=1114960 RepID=H0JRB1_9NOCA|nr:putative rhodanese-related sulfurtransferase [Rhodococcus pyridinivorans AK37]
MRGCPEVAVPKIVLFYKFTPLPDPEAIRLWQHTLASSLGLTGRILISEHGINGTVGGDIVDVKKYVRGLRGYAAFKDTDIKWSDGTGDDFPRLSVKVRPEIVTFGVPDEVKVDENGIVDGGTHLSPHGVHELVAERGDEVVFFDGRNRFEAQIGRFRDAIVPDVATTRDFVAELDSGRYDHLKGRPVVTYCTGGVRCEVLSALMRNRGFEEVYQLDGGIVRYGETFGDEGLWEGSLYVFDGRMNVEFSAEAPVIGRCTLCGTPTSRYRNHPDLHGRELTLVCEGCVPDLVEA